MCSYYIILCTSSGGDKRCTLPVLLTNGGFIAAVMSVLEPSIDPLSLANGNTLKVLSDA